MERGKTIEHSPSSVNIIVLTLSSEIEIKSNNNNMMYVCIEGS